MTRQRTKELRKNINQTDLIKIGRFSSDIFHKMVPCMFLRTQLCIKSTFLFGADFNGRPAVRRLSELVDCWNAETIRGVGSQSLYQSALVNAVCWGCPPFVTYSHNLASLAPVVQRAAASTRVLVTFYFRLQISISGCSLCSQLMNSWNVWKREALQFHLSTCQPGNMDLNIYM